MLSQRGLRASQPLKQRLQALRPSARASKRAYSAGPGEQKLTGAADNQFNRERLAVKAHAAGTSDFWRKLSIYVVIPSLILSGANAWVLWKEHWEHFEHSPPPSERPQYAYMNLRSKSYPWGDGNKTLFWNDKVNYYAGPESG